ncbi:hypothetical protein [Aeromonas salmonicida]|uniref:hypothetical protein n=1 Tax=Aeromonas salmonicida TaxID=645 RepID=UPI001F16ED0B|nr:hypothetical protein [Aeromonas salmonicida]MCE9933626.1 hypothetical protein [Aeromonas salmonicida]
MEIVEVAHGVLAVGIPSILEDAGAGLGKALSELVLLSVKVEVSVLLETVVFNGRLPVVLCERGGNLNGPTVPHVRELDSPLSAFYRRCEFFQYVEIHLIVLTG